MIEAHRAAPVAAVVAVLAARAEVAAVAVVLAMAAAAALRCAAVLAGAWVALRAPGIAMRAEQRPAGLRMVVARGLPVALHVALRAVRAHCAAVRVVVAMAALAILRQPRLDLALAVAAAAFELRVRAGQAELGPGVVEIIDLGPVAGIVAVAAARAQAPGVAVIIAVASLALSRCFAALGACSVAIDALRSGMLAGKCEIRQRVIEVRLVQPRDGAGETQVLAVAGGAGLRWLAPVQAAPRLDIAGRVLVAFQAQPGLCLAVEGGVAAFAFGLVLVMRLRHRPRHQRPFERARLHHAGQPQAQPCQNADQ